jgi:hypothetical protein
MPKWEVIFARSLKVRAGLALILSAALTSLVSAADEKPQGPPERVLMDEVEIRGEVERPEVFYIIPRRQVQMDLGPLSKDYRGEIMRPLLPGPFETWVRSQGAEGRR